MSKVLETAIVPEDTGGNLPPVAQMDVTVLAMYYREIEANVARLEAVRMVLDVSLGNFKAKLEVAREMLAVLEREVKVPAANLHS